jgi:hypothetical protein
VFPRIAYIATDTSVEEPDEGMHDVNDGPVASV